MQCHSDERSEEESGAGVPRSRSRAPPPQVLRSAQDDIGQVHMEQALVVSHTSSDLSGGRAQRGRQPSLAGVRGYPQHPWVGGWEEATVRLNRNLRLVVPYVAWDEAEIHLQRVDQADPVYVVDVARD